MLIEGNPGLGKTQSVKKMANFFDDDFRRVQGTPDLLPVDVLWARAFDPVKKRYEDFFWPIFANIVLIDEINRAPAKLQSAFFEAMAEGQVTLWWAKKSLPKPFHIFATMNILKDFGTFELPEPQKDRFFISTIVSYPSPEEEKLILVADKKNMSEKDFHFSLQDLDMHKEKIKKIHISEELLSSICHITFASRNGKYADFFQYPYSVRASQDLFLWAKIMAYIDGKDAVFPEHIKQIAISILWHRTSMSYLWKNTYADSHDLISDILDNTSWFYEKK